MNSFETVMAELLAKEGFWVQQGFKVDLTKEEKRRIEKPTSPRWELDILAYRGADNELLVVECKSYLDSPGVRFSAFVDSSSRDRSRYKLFNNPVLREVVFYRLARQLEDVGACSPNPQIRLCLAAGKIASENDRIHLFEYFNDKGWTLWDDVWIREKLEKMSHRSYQDESSSIVAKLLLRKERLL